MNKYELTVVLEAKATAAKNLPAARLPAGQGRRGKKVQEAVEKIVTLAKGKIGKIEDWGIIGTGLYLHFPLELNSLTVKEVSLKLNQETEIIKYLLVRHG